MKLLIIDDHTLFRSGLMTLLEHRNIEVKAVGSGSEGLRVLENSDLDIVLLDLRMPDMSGLEVLQWIRQKKYEVPVVMLTTSADERDLIESLRLGAQGYLLKDMDPDDLVNALDDVVSGETIVAPDLTKVLAKVFQKGGPENSKVTHSLHNILTTRELEVLRHITKGQSNKVIARNLGITDGTVKLHVKSILRKLDVHSRVEAAVMAVEEGLS
jgi:two-component system nitrate/nitrite response regulator NarL